MTVRRLLLLPAVAVIATGCATARGTLRSDAPRDDAESRTLVPPSPPPARPAPPPERDRPADVQTGTASWYGRPHHGQKTASGEPYDMHDMTAAHRTLPLGTRVRVVNVANGRSVVVRINDRGPFIDGRIIDVSQAAARALGALGAGVFTARIEIVEDTAADPPPRDTR